ncbi:MAG TPA: hypothetical protein DHV42_00750 [Lachnospiraceae bacterium]|jgi:uncharacterized membrane protein|nr:hypothetical protein [Lachnospiraceae bacterium]
MDGAINVLERILTSTVEVGIVLVEMFGVLVLVYTAVRSFLKWLKRSHEVRLDLAQGTALALEFKMGGEVLRTVVTREKGELLILGGIILLRGILTFLIHWEIKNEEKALEKRTPDEGNTTP